MCFSRQQNTVEASTYGNEMLAMRISIETIEGLHYKLCMLGLPIDGGCNVFCHNNGVVLNTTAAARIKVEKEACCRELSLSERIYCCWNDKGRQRGYEDELGQCIYEIARWCYASLPQVTTTLVRSDQRWRRYNWINNSDSKMEFLVFTH